MEQHRSLRRGEELCALLRPRVVILEHADILIAPEESLVKRAQPAGAVSRHGARDLFHRDLPVGHAAEQRELIRHGLTLVHITQIERMADLQRGKTLSVVLRQMPREIAAQQHAEARYPSRHGIAAEIAQIVQPVHKIPAGVFHRFPSSFLILFRFLKSIAYSDRKDIKKL